MRYWEIQRYWAIWILVGVKFVKEELVTFYGKVSNKSNIEVSIYNRVNQSLSIQPINYTQKRILIIKWFCIMTPASRKVVAAYTISKSSDTKDSLKKQKKTIVLNYTCNYLLSNILKITITYDNHTDWVQNNNSRVGIKTGKSFLHTLTSLAFWQIISLQ